jgi:hypothetical protein
MGSSVVRRVWRWSRLVMQVSMLDGDLRLMMKYQDVFEAGLLEGACVVVVVRKVGKLKRFEGRWIRDEEKKTRTALER